MVVGTVYLDTRQKNHPGRWQGSQQLAHLAQPKFRRIPFRPRLEQNKTFVPGGHHQLLVATLLSDLLIAWMNPRARLTEDN